MSTNDDTQPGAPAVTVSQGIPDMVVIVNDGETLGHDDVMYEPGDEVTLPGPTALALVQMGHVTLKGD